jgi:hypothetical protein
MATSTHTEHASIKTGRGCQGMCLRPRLTACAGFSARPGREDLGREIVVRGMSLNEGYFTCFGARYE